MTFTGLAPNQNYRVTVWMKAGSLRRMFLDVRDGGHIQAGMAYFNLTPPAVTGTSGDVLGADVEPAPNQWVKTSVDLRSADGVIVVYLGQVLHDGSTQFRGALDLHLMLGGMEVRPLQ
jgi:hypothetical protein